MSRLGAGWSHVRLGALARHEGRYELAAIRYTEGRAKLLEAGDMLGVSHADAGLGAMAWLGGNHEHAVALFRSVLEGFRLSEEASNNLFELKTMIQGNVSAAELQEIVQANRERAEMTGDQGARTALGEYVHHIGLIAFSQQQFGRSEQALAESLALCAQTTVALDWHCMPSPRPSICRPKLGVGRTDARCRRSHPGPAHSGSHPPDADHRGRTGQPRAGSGRLGPPGGNPSGSECRSGEGQITRERMKPVRINHQVVVFDAADLTAESTFWAGVLGGTVDVEDNWHMVIVDGAPRVGVQLAPDHVPPDWPDGAPPQQIHLDLWVEDFEEAHDRVMSLGAKVLKPAENTDVDDFQVYADPAGHPFCLCWIN